MILKFFLSIGLVLGITGCSQPLNILKDNINSLKPPLSASVAPEVIAALPYASIYAQIDNNPRAFLVLAYAEPLLYSSISKNTNDQNTSSNIQLKWVSSDSSMLVTENGRIVKTLKLLEGNLLNTDNISSHEDPLKLGLHLDSTPLSWKHTIDWQPGYHMGYTLYSQFQKIDDPMININNQFTQTSHFIETITIDNLNSSYENEYWINPENGAVLKSRQKLAPTLPYIEITMLKPFL